MSYSDCCAKNRLGDGGQRESSQEATAVTQMRDDSGLDQGGHVKVVRSGQNQYILKLE